MCDHNDTLTDDFNSRYKRNLGYQEVTYVTELPYFNLLFFMTAFNNLKNWLQGVTDTYYKGRP